MSLNLCQTGNESRCKTWLFTDLRPRCFQAIVIWHIWLTWKLLIGKKGAIHGFLISSLFYSHHWYCKLISPFLFYFFLLFSHYPVWISWCKSKASASQRQALEASACWRPWDVGRVTLTQSHAACWDQELWRVNHSQKLLGPRRTAVLSGVLALTNLNTNI